MSTQSTKRESGTPEGAFGLIRRHLNTAIVDVFGHYQVVAKAQRTDGPSSGNEEVVVAIIGFAGDRMRGSLVLTAAVRSIDRWRMPFGGVDATTDARDILGEVANMVLGRLKGKLLAEGLPILMSTPTTARGAGVALARTGGPEEQLAFGGDDWRLCARIDAAFDHGFGLQEEPTVVAAEAGDVMLF